MRLRTAALVGDLQAQPASHEPQFTADLLAGRVPHRVGEQLRGEQLRVVAGLLVDLPFGQPVEDSLSGPRDRDVERRQTESVPKRTYRHSGGPIF
jgi:hypothetical protein